MNSLVVYLVLCFIPALILAENEVKKSAEKRRAMNSIYNLMDSMGKTLPQKGPFLGNNLSGQACGFRYCATTRDCCDDYYCHRKNYLGAGVCKPMVRAPPFVRHDEWCHSEQDCASGQECVIVAGRQFGTCKSRTTMKLLHDECQSSEECDLGQGMCCQRQLLFRKSPRNACLLIYDARNCIGLEPEHVEQAVIDTHPNSVFD